MNLETRGNPRLVVTSYSIGRAMRHVQALRGLVGACGHADTRLVDGLTQSPAWPLMWTTASSLPAGTG